MPTVFCARIDWFISDVGNNNFMGFWRSFPNPTWATIWLLIMPPVNLINLVRLILYRRSSTDLDPDYQTVWIIILLSLLATLLLPLSLLALYLLMKSSLFPSYLQDYNFLSQ